MIARYPGCMPQAPRAPMTLLQEAWRPLRQHPGLAFLVAAASALLSTLGPLLQLRLGLPDTLEVNLLLGATATLPLELWLLPRLLLQVDAETLDHRDNPSEGWQARFEARWATAVGARLLLYGAVILGAMLFVLPGLLVLFFFGWVPLRVLLRGESLIQAARWSRALMARAWAPALFGMFLLTSAYLLLLGLLGSLVAWHVPEPSIQDRLLRPTLWLAQALAGLFNFGYSLGILALYQRLEAYASSESSK